MVVSREVAGPVVLGVLGVLGVLVVLERVLEDEAFASLSLERLPPTFVRSVSSELVTPFRPSRLPTPCLLPTNGPASAKASEVATCPLERIEVGLVALGALLLARGDESAVPIADAQSGSAVALANQSPSSLVVMGKTLASTPPESVHARVPRPVSLKVGHPRSTLRREGTSRAPVNKLNRETQGAELQQRSVLCAHYKTKQLRSR